MRYDPIRILLSLPAVVVALTLHELAHAWVADKLGDPTPRQQGRLTLNPIAHVDWIGLIFFAVFGFGWAKPVQTNRLFLRNKKNAQTMVSIAGPLANLAIAFVFTPIFLLCYKTMGTTTLGNSVISIMQNIVWLNIVFFFLNILPIPPLDGYHILKEKLFFKNPNFFLKYEQYSLFVLIALVLLNVFSLVISLPSQAVFQLLIRLFGPII